jgi:hypothetical protein
MPDLTGAERSLLHAATGEVIDAFRNGVAGVLSGQMRSYTHPPEIASFLGALGRLAKTLEAKPVLLDEPGAPISVNDELRPALKLVVLLTRRRLAAELEEPREATAHPALWASFDERLRPFKELMAQDWFKSVEPLRMPRLTDVWFLNGLRNLSGNTSPFQRGSTTRSFIFSRRPRCFFPTSVTFVGCANFGIDPCRLPLSTSMTSND